jgi:hypothetical protein
MDTPADWRDDRYFVILEKLSICVDIFVVDGKTDPCHALGRITVPGFD